MKKKLVRQVIARPVVSSSGVSYDARGRLIMTPAPQKAPVKKTTP